MRPVLLMLALAACARARSGTALQAGINSEILWDTYGVPHIFAKDRNALAYAFGWAQMQNYSDLMLRLIAQARGQASELLGPDYLEEDRWVWTLDLPGLAERQLRAQPTAMRAHLDAFTAGINAFAAAHPETIGDSVRSVLPVTGVDVLSHLNRVLYRFIARRERVRDDTRAWRERGSNAWAIAPAHSASAHTLLLQNPHVPWSDLFTWMEAQYVAPGINVSGATIVLSPVLQIAFNDQLGWTHTVNTQDGQDLYELKLSGDGYLLDGVVRSFEMSTHVLRIRQSDGTFRADTLRVRRSVHGPVVAARPGGAIAEAIVGLHGPMLAGGLTQWWDMGRATNLDEFIAAIRPNQISGQNITYGDRAGHIMMFYGGNSPKRAGGTRGFWAGIVRGDTSGTLWNSLHSFDELPMTLDPPSGWVQNANDPPWWATFPVMVKPESYPAYLASRPMALRPQRSARMLDEDSRITWDEFLQYKNSTRMELADRLLDDLLPAAKRSATESARNAAAILERWDRQADSESRGAVLFTAWWTEYTHRERGRSPYAMPWDDRSPRTTPDGLADTAEAVAALIAVADSLTRAHGSADVPWGKVYRLRRDGLDFGSSGAGSEYGVFRVLNFSDRESDGTFTATGGTSYVGAIEFATPVRAVSVIGYGNASRAGSPHRKDQLELLARKEFKPVWRTRAEIEKHLERRERF